MPPAPSRRQDGAPHSSAFSVLVGSTQPLSPQRAPRDKASRALLVSPGPCGLNLVPGLSVFIASIWASWPDASALVLGATTPGQALPGPSQDKRGTKFTQLGAVSCASPPHPQSPCGVFQAQASTGRGACPCFSSDWEINAPEGVWDGVVYATCVGCLEGMARIQCRSLGPHALDKRLPAANSPVSSLLLASCRDANIKPQAQK